MNANAQALLFRQLKEKMPAYLSLADEVAAILHISTDSAYRRIRGEKPISLEEAGQLCARYELSLDGLLHLGDGSILFTGQYTAPESFRFEEYLANLAAQVHYMNSFAQKKLYYLCKDLPIFHHFHFRELAAFKHYFWMKTILAAPGYEQRRFRFSDYPDELFRLGSKALADYQRLEVVEIWNMESINSTIRQIEFYRDSGQFESEADVATLFDVMSRLIDHLEAQALEGRQYSAETEPPQLKGGYELYFNEVILGDNSLLAELDGQRTAFLVHSVFNFIRTQDPQFCRNQYNHMHNLMRRSTLISSVAERERARFFRYLRLRIEGRKQRKGEK